MRVLRTSHRYFFFEATDDVTVSWACIWEYSRDERANFEEDHDEQPHSRHLWRDFKVINSFIKSQKFGYNNDAYLSNCSCGVSERCKAMDAHMRSIQNWAALCLALAKVDGLSESELGILGSHIN